MHSMLWCLQGGDVDQGPLAAKPGYLFTLVIKVVNTVNDQHYFDPRALK